MVFNFVRAQAALEVPSDTVRLRFRFYAVADGGGALLDEEVREFASQIVIDPVNTATRSVVVTALAADGTPLLQATANASVPAGGRTVVDFASASETPVRVTALTVRPSTSQIEVGETQQFAATATYSTGDTAPLAALTWSSSSPTVATISSSGLATGLADGVTTISASVGAVSGSASLEVGGGPVLSSLLVAPDGESMLVGGLKGFSASGLDQNGDPFSLQNTTVTWSTSPQLSLNSAADATAVVRAETVGNATVTASVGALNGSASVTVLDSTFDGIVSVAPSSPVALQINGTSDQAVATLVVTGSFSDAPDRPLTNADGLNYLISGGLGVVNVSSDGVVTALAVGETEITVSAGSFSQTVAVNVSNAGGNQPPVITLPESVMESYLIAGAGYATVYGTTVSDDQANLNGGTLNVSSDTVLTLRVPSTAIGTVTGNLTNSLSIALNSNATPQAIANLLDSLVLTTPGNAVTEEGSLRLSLSDGRGGTAEAQRDFIVIDGDTQYLTVNRDAERSSMNFWSIGEALGNVTQAGAVVSLAPGDYSSEGTIAIGNQTQLFALQLRGPRSRVPSGALPAGTTFPAFTGVDATLNSIAIDNSNVTVTGVVVSRAGGVGILASDDSSNTTVRNSRIVGVAYSGQGVLQGGELSGSHTGFALVGNTITGWNEGVRLRSVFGQFSDIVVSFNVFEDNANVGLAINRPLGATVLFNSFVNGSVFHFTPGLEVGDSLTTFNNDFLGTGSVTLFSGTSQILDVTENFWGGRDPAGYVGVIGSGTVDYDPVSTGANTNYPPAP